jgi:hypothetical protein
LSLAATGKFLCNKTLEEGHALTETLAFFSTPGAKFVSKMIRNYCLNNLSQQVSKMLNAEIKVAQSHAIDAVIAFDNERYDEVKELWKKSYDEGIANAILN